MGGIAVSDHEMISFSEDGMYELAMSFRSIASKMYQALLESVTEGNCKCEYHPDIRGWYERMNNLPSMADRMRYAQRHPCPDIDEPVISQCRACEAICEYHNLVGQDVSIMERNTFLRESQTMPSRLRQIFEEELGEYSMEDMVNAFMSGQATEEMISAVERAQSRANDFLRDYDDGH